MALNLYRVSQGYKGYDTYDSAVVAAENAEDAKTIHPRGLNWDDPNWDNEASIPWRWAKREWTEPENVSVEYLGVADESIERGAVCASYNAG